MTRFSLKIVYGIMATIELARHENSQPIQAKIIAQRQGIPSRFIEQIMQGLKHNGIVRSARGAQGGYTLALPASHISLAHVVKSMNGSQPDEALPSESIHHDGGTSDPRHLSTVLLSEIWKKVEEAELAVLNKISVQSLLEQYEKLETQGSLMYHI